MGVSTRRGGPWAPSWRMAIAASLHPMLFAGFMGKYDSYFVWVFLTLTIGVNVFSSSVFYPEREVLPVKNFREW